jgi:exopolysaccharide biosynthesis protein
VIVRRRLTTVSVLVGAAALLAGGRGTDHSAATLALGPVSWVAARPGVQVGTAPLAAPGEGRWTRVILVRLDPSRVRLQLATHLNNEMTAGAWSLDDVPSDAVAAFNAGQFNGIAPWGWTVMEGLELRPPGVGPLSMAVVMDTSGTVRFVEPDSIAMVRARGGIETAIQSYPALLVGAGTIPATLSTPGSGVGISHRDARLAIGQLAEGQLLVLMTRFHGLGEFGGSIPFGLTLHETAELLRSLGVTRAVALDGGISAQLLVRDSAGSSRAWRAWRKVPLGVVVKGR